MIIVRDTNRVLFVDQSGEIGGAELSLFDLARGRKGISEVVLLSDGPFRKMLLGAGVSVTVLKMGIAVNIKRNSGILRGLISSPSLLVAVFRLAIKSRQFDLVYSNTQKALVISALAVAISRRPLIWHLRDILTEEHFGRVNRRIAIFLANRFARSVIANSEATAAAYVASGGTAPLQVVYNGIDAAPFDAIDRLQARLKLRSEIGVSGGTVVGVFSRFAPWKGQHVIVEACKGMRDVHVVFCGGSLFGELAYEQAVRARAASLGLLDRCHFLGFRSDVPLVMKGVDIIAHVSISPEPFGRVIVEGMLAELPVIATRGGGASEIIEDRKTGVLVPPGDAVALRNALADIIEEPKLAREIALRGAAFAKGRFSLGAHVRTVESIITRNLI